MKSRSPILRQCIHIQRLASVGQQDLQACDRVDCCAHQWRLPGPPAQIEVGPSTKQPSHDRRMQAFAGQNGCCHPPHSSQVQVRPQRNQSVHHRLVPPPCRIHERGEAPFPKGPILMRIYPRVEPPPVLRKQPIHLRQVPVPGRPVDRLHCWCWCCRAKMCV